LRLWLMKLTANKPELPVSLALIKN
jgi:hypothetical protein